MRLTQIKLSGFKSFVDPTAIATPGQLVGIVGPNGCGKSNVIDAVRWVLGESKASALRGESMQDVIFNGAGERKPVGRASVELHFDNDQGRIGGQWGQYAEISIKRVLTRDGDSTYYINNIPVRRRDIHDLFLGTGLGPRAYAIIEQGMISRVIEAKPEELRVFLEEAAGVSKYKERRKETEGRLADARENLARVEDIRLELGNQLERLATQARVATEYRDLEARLKQSQHLLWFAKQQDAVRVREKCTTEMATLTVALESLQAELRAAEAKLEALRTDHYAAGDVLHEKQGGFYAANAEVTRLEQQLSFARESESRLTQQVAQLTEALGAIAGQEAALSADQGNAERELEAALTAREKAAEGELAAQSTLPALEQAVAETSRILAEQGERIAMTEQNVRVAETRRDSVAGTLSQLAARQERLQQELAGIRAPTTDPLREVEAQLAAETRDLAGKHKALDALQHAVESLQAKARETADAWQRDSQRLGDLEARSQALSALQAKIGHGQDIDEWLAAHGLHDARRLWQSLAIERGWEDALESVLRERLNALELARLRGRRGVDRRRRAAAAAHRRLCIGTGASRAAIRRRFASGQGQAVEGCGRTIAGRRPARHSLPAGSCVGARRPRRAGTGRSLRHAGGTCRHGARRHFLRARQRAARRAGTPARTGRACGADRHRDVHRNGGAGGARRHRRRAESQAANVACGEPGRCFAAAARARPGTRARAAYASCGSRGAPARPDRAGNRGFGGAGGRGTQATGSDRRANRRPAIADA